MAGLGRWNYSTDCQPKILNSFISLKTFSCIRLNKKVKVFRVMGLKSLGRVGTHIKTFLGKYIILCILKGILPLKMHKITFFPENLKKF